MFAKIKTAGLRGIEGFMVEVEADMQTGLPGFYLTGALSSETREAQYRIMNAIKNSGIRMEPRKITVNFSPAALRKDGTSYDLPIAVAVLCAMGLADYKEFEHTAFFGETGLDGSLKPVRGALPMAFTCRENGATRVIVPKGNEAEAVLAEGIEVIGCRDIPEVLGILSGSWSSRDHRRRSHMCTSREEGCDPSERRSGVSAFPERTPDRSTSEGWSAEEAAGAYRVDFSEVHGQEYLKRAAEIAVSGGHNFLMSGPAGTGKSMIAKRMPTIMPDLGRDEDIEISKIYSICGLLSEDRPLLGHRPFRSPHHGISEAAFAGGGNMVMPGEISLASGGILFLDELPLFQRNTLEMLRQPLEDKRITVTRMKGSYTYPADFILVGAMNNCPCGYFPDRSRCHCTKAQIRAYMGRLSKPLLERIDICAEARPVGYGELTGTVSSETSAVIRKRVEETRLIQEERFSTSGRSACNGQMGIREVEHYCRLGKEETDFMREIYQTRGLSGRTYHKILKVARTIADMGKSDNIGISHLAEAVELRSMEDSLFPAAASAKEAF